MYQIAVIGSGNRLTPLVKKLLQNNDFTLKAVCDIDPDSVKKRYADLPDVQYFTDAEQMLQTCKPDGVLIGTRCSTHAHFSLLCAQYDIPIFLEKPVCTTFEDLARLQALQNYSDKVVVSFPLRRSAIVEKVKEILDSGRIGRIAQVQAYNNVPYGRGYYHKWYRDDHETGGLFLQKTTHDFDYLNYILGDLRPTRICAVASKQVFKGDRPKNLRCLDCDMRAQCPEDPDKLLAVGSSKNGLVVPETSYCCFAEDTGNQDSGSAIVLYENGLHVVYTQNFIVRNEAGKRGARFIGFYGTLQFDFRTDVIEVFDHLEQRIEVIRVEARGSHFGGDDFLIDNFADVVRGHSRSLTPLADGILSAKMCLYAQKSSEDFQFYDL